MNTNKKLVIFDLDGTLNDTSLYVIPATRRALAEMGVTGITDEEIMRNVGASWREACERYLPGQPQEVHRAYSDRYSQAERELCRERHGTFPGVPELLRQLKAEGYLLAICSNASLRYIKMVCGYLEFLPYFDDFAPLEPEMTEKAQSMKKLLDRLCPDWAVMAGDRHYDLEAARKNGVPFIGCGYGYQRPGELDGADFYAAAPFQVLQGVHLLEKRRP